MTGKTPSITDLLRQVLEALSLTAAQEADPAKEASESTAKPTADIAAALQAIRDDLKTYGTAIGVGSLVAILTAAVTNMDKLFPGPGGSQLPKTAYWLALVICVLLAIVGSILLTSRFFAARRRVLINTDDYIDQPHQLKGLDQSEAEVIYKRLAKLAESEGVASIPVLERRISRLQRVALTAKSGGQDKAAAAAIAEADRVGAALNLAVSEAALLVLERRSADVYRQPFTTVFAATAAIGIAGVFLLGQWAQSDQDKTARWLACQTDLKDSDKVLHAVERRETCARLEPDHLRPVPKASTTESPDDGSASPTRTTYPTASTWIITNLDECASVKTTSSLSANIRDRALAACAGLPAASPSASATSD
ncbi:hypothetical protein [Kineosporia sp. A_224]|uniref:hypothetical protein n=1 Tax=Kineosporia sp. A_224 TaxID=1962180 RepID=UPI000B4B362B|nr:hypothetical protein [Kineosporia sp. A_224]